MAIIPHFCCEPRWRWYTLNVKNPDVCLIANQYGEVVVKCRKNPDVFQPCKDITPLEESVARAIAVINFGLDSSFLEKDCHQ
jgi:hypothetical protein